MSSLVVFNIFVLIQVVLTIYLIFRRLVNNVKYILLQDVLSFGLFSNIFYGFYYSLLFQLLSTTTVMAGSLSKLVSLSIGKYAYAKLHKLT